MGKGEGNSLSSKFTFLFTSFGIDSDISFRSWEIYWPPSLCED